MGTDSEDVHVPRKRPFRGLGRSILGTFVNLEEEETEAEFDASSATSAESETSKSSVALPPPSEAESAVNAERFYAQIMKDLAAQNDALTAFKDAYDMFDGVISDETERRAAAFKTVTKQGHSKQEVLEAIQRWIAQVPVEIEEERVEALTAVEDRLATARAEVEGIDSEIQRRRAQIAELQQQEVELTTRKATEIANIERGERNLSNLTSALARAEDRAIADLKRLYSEVTS